jgi:hypothetical protein
MSNIWNSIPAVALLIGLCAPGAFADTAEATCELRKHGNVKQDGTGPCTFSQRQGYVDITLRNGESFSLSPADKANRYRDQNGKHVSRSVNGQGAQEYQWDGQKVTVRFGGGSGSHSSHQGASGGSHPVGDTPQNLRNLVGGKWVGAEVEDEMSRRGYRHVSDSQSGGEVWSNYRPTSGGQCVVVRLNQSRHVSSVAYGTENCN